MGRRRRLLLCAMGLALAACKGGEGRAPEAGGGSLIPTEMEMEADGPTGEPSGEPSGPGLEPPQTDPGETAGSPPDVNETPAGMQPGAEPTDFDPRPGGTGGMGAPPPGAAGTGMAGQAGTSGQAAGQDGGTPAADCAVLVDCGTSAPTCTDELHCIALPSCAGAAKCIAVEAACQRECGAPTCALLESYPEQVRCE